MDNLTEVSDNIGKESEVSAGLPSSEGKTSIASDSVTSTPISPENVDSETSGPPHSSMQPSIGKGDNNPASNTVHTPSTKPNPTPKFIIPPKPRYPTRNVLSSKRCGGKCKKVLFREPEPTPTKVNCQPGDGTHKSVAHCSYDVSHMDTTPSTLPSGSASPIPHNEFVNPNDVPESRVLPNMVLKDYGHAPSTDSTLECKDVEIPMDTDDVPSPFLEVSDNEHCIGVDSVNSDVIHEKPTDASVSDIECGNVSSDKCGRKPWFPVTNHLSNPVVANEMSLSHNFPPKEGFISPTHPVPHEEVKKRVLEECTSPPPKRFKSSVDASNFIHRSVVVDRNLFHECSNGDLEKLKYSVRLDSYSNLPTLWVGVTGKCSPFKAYICQKNEDNVMSSFYTDIETFNRVHANLIGFGEKGKDYQPFEVDNKSPRTTTLSISNHEQQGPLLVLNHNAPIGKNVKEVKFDLQMVKQYIAQCWSLRRFISYLKKREDILKFGESIILQTDTIDNNEEFGREWFIEAFDASTPPNRVLTSSDVWTLLKKKYM